MEWNLSLFGFAGAALALLFAYAQSRKVFGYSEGTERMQKLAAAIRKGANAYLKQQYATVFKVFLVVFVVLLILAATGNLNWFTPFAFLHRRFVERTGRLCGHEDRHQRQRAHCPGGLREPEQGPAGGFLFRQRHGLHRGGPGHAGYFPLVTPSCSTWLPQGGPMRSR